MNKSKPKDRAAIEREIRKKERELVAQEDTQLDTIAQDNSGVEMASQLIGAQVPRPHNQ